MSQHAGSLVTRQVIPGHLEGVKVPRHMAAAVTLMAARRLWWKASSLAPGIKYENDNDNKVTHVFILWRWKMM